MKTFTFIVLTMSAIVVVSAIMRFAYTAYMSRSAVSPLEKNILADGIRLVTELTRRGMIYFIEEIAVIVAAGEPIVYVSSSILSDPGGDTKIKLHLQAAMNNIKSEYFNFEKTIVTKPLGRSFNEISKTAVVVYKANKELF